MSEPVADGKSASPVQGGAGAALLAERRRQGLSLGDISRQLKLSVRQVEALERDDFSGFGGPVFVHGFIRNYAKLLGLNAEQLIRAADTMLNPAPAEKEPAGSQPPQREIRRSRAGTWPAAAGVTLAVLVFGVVYLGTRGEPKQRPGQAEALVQAESRPADPAAEPKREVADRREESGLDGAVAAEPAEQGDRVTVRMVFDQESWVEIKDRSGNTLFGQLNPAGTRRSVSGQPPLNIIIGNAAGVHLFRNDKGVDLAPYTRVDVARLTLE